MKRTVYNKLVRDRIPEIIEEAGENLRIKRLSKVRFEDELRKKLREEVEDVLFAKKSKLAEEIADVKEILLALGSLHGISAAKIEHIRKLKEKKRGGFKKRIFLIDTF